MRGDGVGRLGEDRESKGNTGGGGGLGSTVVRGLDGVGIEGRTLG